MKKQELVEMLSHFPDDYNIYFGCNYGPDSAAISITKCKIRKIKECECGMLRIDCDESLDYIHKGIVLL